jgi:hypothetical protein
MVSNTGKYNIGVGLLVMAAFMVYGFILIYLRDFSPDRAVWLESSLDGEHFEASLAHAHGNLFSLLNIVFGFLLLKLPLRSSNARWISWLALAGLLMPIGILAEVYLSLPPYLVIVGGLSILLATAWLGIEVMRMRNTDETLSVG